MRISRATVTVCTAALLSGCVAVWGGSYKIDSSDSKRVTIDYDTGLTNAAKLRSVAVKECQKYNPNNDAVVETDAGRGIHTVSFRCVVD